MHAWLLSRDVWSKIPAYADYGFAVFQLKELAGTPHPIAFEFDTRLDETMFSPTVHIHDGTVHERDDFDHVLYMQSAALDAGSAASAAQPTRVRSQAKAAAFVDVPRTEALVAPGWFVHRSKMHGSLPNKDMHFDLRAAIWNPTTFERTGSGGNAGPTDHA